MKGPVHELRERVRRNYEQARLEEKAEPPARRSPLVGALLFIALAVGVLLFLALE